MRIATVNVNGIRAAARKGISGWLEASAPDVLVLQEVRADETTASSLLPGYRSAGEVRRGVAPPDTAEPDVDSGRWLEVDLGVEGTPGSDGAGRHTLTIVSAYLHSGRVGTEKMDQKYAHLELVDARMAELLDSSESGGPQVVMAGDLNVVRSERDIKNWKPNHNKSAGVLDEEIAHLEGWFAAGWVDVARSLAPDRQGPYTWWSQRGKAFDNDVGWRIDYQVATPRLARRAASLTVDRADSYDARWSDHAPLVIDYVF